MVNFLYIVRLIVRLTYFISFVCSSNLVVVGLILYIRTLGFSGQNESRTGTQLF